MKKIRYTIYFLLIFILKPVFSFGQVLHQLNHDLNVLNEQSVASDSSFHFSIKPYTHKEFLKLVHEPTDSNSVFHNRFLNEPLYSKQKENFVLSLNPLIHSLANSDASTSSLYSDNRIGFSLNYSYKDKIFLNSDVFYSGVYFSEINKSFADSFGIIPHYGKVLSDNDNYYTFLSYNGELTYTPTESISFHVGNGKHFLGNGYRSLFLSDNSSSYPYFKTTVDIWRIKYVWMVAKLQDFELYNFQQKFDLYDKAVFIHYFSINLTNRINFNFFEAIISNPYDQKRNRIGYELAYFNPVIFYRPVEFYAGTSDNSLMGVGLNLRLFKSLHLYSQFILDDLIISRLSDGSGWWGNKFGIQAGLKAYHVLNVEGLFFRGEINLVRPYTYSHGISVSKDAVANINYGHMHQNLAHPAGANFAEAISVISYNKERFMANAKVILSKRGIDKDSVSYGSDIYKDYNLRPDNNGIIFLQGEISDFAYFDFNVSYVINPYYNLRFELGLYHRKEINSLIKNVNTIFYFGLTSRLFNEEPGF